MKQELLINIVLGFISLGVIGLILMSAKPPQTVPPPAAQSKQSTISINDFTRHNNAKDCWIRINGKVYDVTIFLNEHPGGADLILPFCGSADATEAFATKDGRGSHPGRATALLQQLLVGTLTTP